MIPSVLLVASAVADVVVKPGDVVVAWALVDRSSDDVANALVVSTAADVVDDTILTDNDDDVGSSDIDVVSCVVGGETGGAGVVVMPGLPITVVGAFVSAVSTSVGGV